MPNLANRCSCWRWRQRCRAGLFLLPQYGRMAGKIFAIFISLSFRYHWYVCQIKAHAFLRETWLTFTYTFYIYSFEIIGLRADISFLSAQNASVFFIAMAKSDPTKIVISMILAVLRSLWSLRQCSMEDTQSRDSAVLGKWNISCAPVLQIHWIYASIFFEWF